MKSKLGALLVAALPMVVFAIVIISITSNNRCTVVKIPSAYGKGTGYAATDPELQIEASPHIRWVDMQRHSVPLIVVGFVLFILSGALPYLLEDKFNSVWQGILIVMLCWVLGAISILGKFSFQNDSAYNERVTEKDFHNKFHDDCKAVFVR
jgi:hypothetical protein